MRMLLGSFQTFHHQYRKVTKIRDALRALDYDLDEMKTMGFSLDNPAWLAGGDVLSATVNLPVDRVIMKMNNIRDAMDEDNEMWAKVALLAGWQEWELGLSEEQLKDLRIELGKGKPVRYESIDYENVTYGDVKYK